MTAAPVLCVDNASFEYVRRSGPFGRVSGQTKVLFDVSLALRRGEVLGLLGESGSGKSTLGRLMLGLIEPASGTVLYNGSRLADMPKTERREFRKKAQLIFQDPYSALDPTMPIADAVTEPLQVQGKMRASDKAAVARSLLAAVNLDAEIARRYPSELSGGQRQRVVIARALSVEPDFIVADEPVASLDVSIQAQILVMLQRLRESHGLTMLFISHDVSVVHYIADRIAVMYLGRIVELGPAAEVMTSPRHPYTRALLASVPGAGAKNAAPSGEIDTSAYTGQGCPFRPRCTHAQPCCAEQQPALVSVGGDHSHACMLQQ